MQFSCLLQKLQPGGYGAVMRSTEIYRSAGGPWSPCCPCHVLPKEMQLPSVSISSSSHPHSFRRVASLEAGDIILTRECKDSASKANYSISSGKSLGGSLRKSRLYGQNISGAGVGRRQGRNFTRRTGDGAPHATSSGVLGDSSEPEFAQEAGISGSTEKKISFSEKVSLFQDAFWRFLRPHTIRGTVIGSTALVARALIENPQLINWVLLPKALRGLLALLCGNGYIVGINQIYDVGIDKINKPFLPIAAGDLSVPAAWGLVLGLASLGIVLVATNFGSLITGLYAFGLFLGTIYSVPPFHLKRFAVPAFLIIATVRGFLLNFGVYYATRAALGLSFEWNPPIVFITSFVTVFATVIAITKDIPDVEGDRKFNISTFATGLGVRRISFLGSGLLLANYVGAVAAAIYLPHAFNQKVMIPANVVLAAALVYQTVLLESAKYTRESIAAFYRFIWNLFYAQYALLPFI